MDVERELLPGGTDELLAVFLFIRFVTPSTQRRPNTSKLRGVGVDDLLTTLPGINVVYGHGDVPTPEAPLGSAFVAGLNLRLKDRQDLRAAPVGDEAG